MGSHQRLVRGFFLLTALLASSVARAEILGYVDTFHEEKGELSILGWACEVGRAQPIDLHVYAISPADQGGKMFASGKADQPGEAAINERCQTPLGTNHRFAIKVAGAHRKTYAGKPVFVHGLALSGLGPNPVLAEAKAIGGLPAPSVNYPDKIDMSKLHWSIAGPIKGETCVKVNEPSEPRDHAWGDNYLCSPVDYGFEWSYRGKIPDMDCTLVNEPSDPHAWKDNYLCAPKDYGLKFSNAGRAPNMACVAMNEPSDPHTWNDNFLCGPGAGEAPNNPGTPTTPTNPGNPGTPYGGDTGAGSKEPVKGWIDIFEPQSDGSVRVVGWACHTKVEESIGLHIYVGKSAYEKGRMIMAATTGQPRGDANEVCGTGAQALHGFDFVIPADAVKRNAGEPVYVHGLAKAEGVHNSAIGKSGEFRLPNEAGLSDLARTNNRITVPEGAVVTIDKSLEADLLEVKGVLQCPTSGNGVHLKVGGIVVSGKNAAFNCGSMDQRLQGKITIELKGGTMAFGAERSIVVANGAQLKLFGNGKNTKWLRLADHAKAGDSSIRLESGTDWSAGDEIAIASTSWDPAEAERRVIKEVSEGGQVITFSEPLKFKHWGQVQRFIGKHGKQWDLDERAEVANLTRNIKITAGGTPESLDYLGGHVMVMRGSHAQVDGVEFEHMGRMGEMMRYPFHWHRMGDVKGQFIVNSSVHDSFQRCITVHGSHNALVENNVCVNHYGHGYFLEDGDETGNILRRNLSIWARKPLKDRHLLQSDIDESNPQRWRGPSSFWISNPNNDISGNVAAGSEGTGFWNSFAQAKYCHADGSDSCRLVRKEQGNTFPASSPTAVFHGNVAHSSRIAFTWDGAETMDAPKVNNPRNAEDQPIGASHYYPGGIPTLEGNHAWKSSTGIYVRADTMEFKNSIFADNGLNLFFAFNQIFRDSAIVGYSNNFDFHADVGKYYKFGMPDVVTGVWVYDGPFELRNVDFLNFSTEHKCHDNLEITAVPFTSLGGENRFTNSVSGLGFFPNPVERVRTSGSGFIDNVTDYAIRDEDGSLSGMAGGTVVPAMRFDAWRPTCRGGNFQAIPAIDKGSSLNYDESCRDAENSPSAMVCQQERGLFKVHAYNDGYSQNDGRIPFMISGSHGRQDADSANAVEAKLGEQPWYAKNKFGVVTNKNIEFTMSFSDNYVRTFFSKLKSDADFSKPRFLISFQSERVGKMSPLLRMQNLGRCKLENHRQLGSLAEIRALGDREGEDGAYVQDGNDLVIRLKTDRMHEVLKNNPRAIGAKSGNWLWDVLCP